MLIIFILFFKILMDIVGFLVKIKKGNRFIFIIVDDVMCYLEVFVLKSCDVESVVNVFIEFFSWVGILKVILID